MMEKNIHVFVYGTLKAGLSNHGCLEGASFVGQGVSVKPFRMVNGGFPAVLNTNQGHNVSGEVYAVDEAILRRLDRLEGYPDMFSRIETPVDIEDTGIQQACWMYIGNPDLFSRRADVQPDASGAYNWRGQ